MQWNLRKPHYGFMHIRRLKKCQNTHNGLDCTRIYVRLFAFTFIGVFFQNIPLCSFCAIINLHLNVRKHHVYASQAFFLPKMCSQKHACDVFFATGKRFSSNMPVNIDQEINPLIVNLSWNHKGTKGRELGVGSGESGPKKRREDGRKGSKRRGKLSKRELQPQSGKLPSEVHGSIL